MATQGVVTVSLVPVATAVPTRRFLVVSGSNVGLAPDNSDKAIGVSQQASAADRQDAIPMAIFNGAIVEVESNEAIAVGDEIASSANGRAKTAGVNPVLGIALTAASAAGEVVEVVLVRSPIQ